jgi:hypothetical protein
VIKHYVTSPYSPQQNGVVERRNQTVIGMPRSLLKSKGMPGLFLGGRSSVNSSVSAKQSTDWKKAIQAELDSIEENGTWELSKQPAGQREIWIKWVYKSISSRIPQRDLRRAGPKNLSSRVSQSPFLSGVPSASPSHRERSGHAGHIEKRSGEWRGRLVSDSFKFGPNRRLPRGGS